MAAQYYPLAIQHIQRETEHCVAITLAVPAELQPIFHYSPGQSVSIKATIHNQEVRRNYSICTAPHQQRLTIAVKEVPGGLFSTYANRTLQVGDVLQVLPPTGRFTTSIQPTQAHKYVAIAAGSGITPILSILTTLLHHEPLSHCTLVYSNQNRSSIIFFEALEALKNKYMNRLHIIHILSRQRTDVPLLYGRVTPAKLESLKGVINYPSIHKYFVCGPQDMIFATRDYLLTQGVLANSVHFELFAGTTPAKENTTTVVVNDATPKSMVTVQQDGRSTEFELAYNTLSILDAAMQHNVDLPFACKGGVCCTCRAKLVTGEVHMEVNYALEPAEVANGYILTCQAKPISQVVVVNFDEQ